MTKLEKEIVDAIKLNGKQFANIDFNSDSFEAYGLKMKREQKVNAEEVEKANADTIEKLEKYPTLKKLTLDAIVWFNEIRVLNCVEKHYNCFGVGSRKHRDLDVDLVAEIIKEEKACAAQDGFEGPYYKFINAPRLILDLCPLIVVCNDNVTKKTKNVA